MKMEIYYKCNEKKIYYKYMKWSSPMKVIYLLTLLYDLKMKRNSKNIIKNILKTQKY